MCWMQRLKRVFHIDIERRGALGRRGHRLPVPRRVDPGQGAGECIAAFQAGQGDVFLISLEAGGTGLKTLIWNGVPRRCTARSPPREPPNRVAAMPATAPESSTKAAASKPRDRPRRTVVDQQAIRAAFAAPLHSLSAIAIEPVAGTRRAPGRVSVAFAQGILPDLCRAARAGKGPRSGSCPEPTAMLPHAACKLLFSFPAIGRERWAAPEEVVGLAASPGEFLVPYQPAQRYFLLDVGGYTGSLPGETQSGGGADPAGAQPQSGGRGGGVRSVGAVVVGAGARGLEAGVRGVNHTASPMKFLNEILGRPKSAERPFLVLVVGYPDENAMVPDIGRKPLGEVVTYVIC